MPAGASVPERLARRVRRCLEAPVEVLVEQGVIPSAEVLAKVVPQLTSRVRAADIADPSLRRLFGAIYTAFRRRRSLLLLNLERQTRLEDLPWVRAIRPFRVADPDTRGQARQALEQLVALSVTAFPQQIFPNKLLQEVRALAEGAGLRLPVVDEVAADIFMGTFSEKFLLAAQAAGDLLTGTLYERYYALPYDRVALMAEAKRAKFGPPTSESFDRLCFELAGEPHSRSGRTVAGNGKVIEQEQILTTHNLAVLFDALGLREHFRPRLEELAFRCFVWVCDRRRQKIDARKARLQMVKNAAYAWRQMVFLLSLLPQEAGEGFLAKADARLGEEKPELQVRFRPALHGLANAIRGLPVESAAHLGERGGRRFLGWVTGPHWLLGE